MFGRHAVRTGFYIATREASNSATSDHPGKRRLRPAVVLGHVQGADLFRIKTPKAAGCPVILMRNVADISVNVSGSD